MKGYEVLHCLLPLSKLLSRRSRTACWQSVLQRFKEQKSGSFRCTGSFVGRRVKPQFPPFLSMACPIPMHSESLGSLIQKHSY